MRKSGAAAGSSKRASILDAALTVFGREGYADASVDEIARTAGAAKPTVYNHFGDKATLFSEAIAAASAQSNARVGDVIDSIDVRPDDLRAELERIGGALVGCLLDEDGVAVMRLQLAERQRFPELLDDIRDTNRERTIDRLAGKLAQIAAVGLLRIDDPDRAARHLMALVSDDLLIRSGFGAVRMRPEDTVEPVRSGVTTFLDAFGAE
ncbi:TetR/AcrR family transcriptional regulator [Pseudoclavibacter chungangensis]|uniref:TetR/AcrR family transcriptional regulator n=1 Tax=Pseudoclavibacter chungangensis TaxID=587635 RepID=A0A7J5BM92_9MICO|nr:TetR/AcrR family transcriptional regulator [Pseudoclavibacter chungangensis]KAB1652098.1 TetR/AcrR family transcriptional regulator [Pseudoclavibacter chungangensis]NYJ65975.1 AcrR family transcriptional regulator [Pseudoclavibacter chungangensis]